MTPRVPQPLRVRVRLERSGAGPSGAGAAERNQGGRSEASTAPVPAPGYGAGTGVPWGQFSGAGHATNYGGAAAIGVGVQPIRYILTVVFGNRIAKLRRGDDAHAAIIMATASLPRRTGRGMESEAAAADRGAIDKAIVAVLFQGGLRRSEAAALRWGDVQDAADGRGIVVYVRRSKTDQDGTAADVRYLKNGCAAGASPAPRPAHRAAVRVASGWHRPGARRHQRPVHRTAPHGSGQRRRHRGANHRALRAGRPCRRIDQARRTGAGDGQGGRVEVVTDGRPLRGGRRSRAGRRR